MKRYWATRGVHRRVGKTAWRIDRFLQLCEKMQFIEDRDLKENGPNFLDPFKDLFDEVIPQGKNNN